MGSDAPLRERPLLIHPIAQVDAMLDPQLERAEHLRPALAIAVGGVERALIFAPVEGAGLVVAARRGRERLNHLNALPIRDIYTRWIAPYAEGAVGRLERLRDGVE
jgi:hypothetical protein